MNNRQYKSNTTTSSNTSGNKRFPAKTYANVINKSSKSPATNTCPSSNMSSSGTSAPRYYNDGVTKCQRCDRIGHDKSKCVAKAKEDGSPCNFKSMDQKLATIQRDYPKPTSAGQDVRNPTTPTATQPKVRSVGSLLPRL